MFTKKKYLKIFVGFLITFSLILYISWNYLQWNNNEDDFQSLERGVITNEPFPDVGFVDLYNKPFQIEKINKGKVLLVYLVDGCDACSDEVSIILNLQKKAELDSKVWGIVRESSNKAKNLNEQAESIPIVIDYGDRLRQELKIKAFPYNILLKDGIIIKKWIGIKDEETLLNHLKDF